MEASPKTTMTRSSDRSSASSPRRNGTLACLEAKAEKMSLEFGLLSNWLRRGFPAGVDLPTNLSVEKGRSLVSEIKEMKGHIESLEKRRADFGV